MRRLIAVICLALIFVPQGTTVGAPAVAKFFEIEISHTSIGYFAGAADVWKTVVLLRKNGKPIGNGYWSCTYVTDTDYQRVCRATYKLPEGDIELAGIVVGRKRDIYFMNITAGSGVYLGRNGSTSFRTIPSIRVGYYGSQSFRTIFVTFVFSER